MPNGWKGQAEYNSKYNKENYSNVHVRLKKSDEESITVIEHLKQQKSMSQYIKKLVLDDIKRSKRKKMAAVK